MEEEIEVQLNEADQLYISGKFFEAHFAYQNLIRATMGKKIPVEQKNLIKNRLKECVLRSKNEYKEISTEMNLTPEMIESITRINNETIEKVGGNLLNLTKIAFSVNFISASKDIEEKSNKNIPLFLQIASMSSVTEDGYVSGNNEDYSAFEINLFKNYQMEQTLKGYLHTNYILKKLIDEKIFTTENFRQLLSEKGLTHTDSNDFEILTYGIENYIKQDFISAIHILVPQFENLLLLVAESAGIQTTVIERGKATTKKVTLSDLFLKSEKMLNVFGKDFCLYLRYSLYSPLGLSIRHKIAHGTITKDECSESNCNLVVVSIFILLDMINKKI